MIQKTTTLDPIMKPLYFLVESFQLSSSYSVG